MLDNRFQKMVGTVILASAAVGMLTHVYSLGAASCAATNVTGGPDASGCTTIDKQYCTGHATDGHLYSWCCPQHTSGTYENPAKHCNCGGVSNLHDGSLLVVTADCVADP